MKIKKIKILPLLYILYTNGYAQHSLDYRPLSYFQQHRTPLLNTSAKVVGIGVYPLTVLEPLTELGVGIYTKDSILKKKALQNGLSVAVGMGLSTILKYTIHRPRPYLTYPSFIPIATENTPSFPSGHTTAAFITATNLSLTFQKWYVILPAYTYAAFVGFTRIYGGVHYPSDVLAGAIIGSGSSLLTHFIYKKINKKPLLTKQSRQSS